MNLHDGPERPGFIADGVPASVGRYELITPLGKGGMAVVYLARNVGSAGFERLAAVKLMHRNLIADEDFVAMFLDEARVAARLHHPNVAAIIDLGNESGELYMVMDYVEGDTLAAVQRTAINVRRAIPLGIVLRITLDALAGLDAAHELKGPDGAPLHLIHRDATPQNILIGVDGAARLVDFGIARAERRLGLTSVGMLKGKAPFMAPEQLEGRAIDRRADIFSMGVTLWETLTLRRCFPQRAGAELLTRSTQTPYRSLREIAAHVPQALDTLCAKALAHHPQDRFSTAAAFADALETTFKSDIATQRETGHFMSAVAAQKVSREREAVRALSASDRSGTHGAPRARQDTPTARVALPSAPSSFSRTATTAELQPPPTGNLLDVLAPSLSALDASVSATSDSLFSLPDVPDLDSATSVASLSLPSQSFGSTHSPRKSTPPPANPHRPPIKRISTLAPNGLPRPASPAFTAQAPSPVRAATPAPLPSAQPTSDTVRRIQNELIPASSPDDLYELPTQMWAQAKERPSVSPPSSSPRKSPPPNTLRVPTRPGARPQASQPLSPPIAHPVSTSQPHRAPTHPGPRAQPPLSPFTSPTATQSPPLDTGFLRVPTRPGVRPPAPQELKSSGTSSPNPTHPKRLELSPDPDEIDLPQEPIPLSMVEPAPLTRRAGTQPSTQSRAGTQPSTQSSPLASPSSPSSASARAKLPLTLPLPSEPPAAPSPTHPTDDDKRLPTHFVRPPRPPIFTPLRIVIVLLTLGVLGLITAGRYLH